MITVLFGPPGSGKGTQAQFLASTLAVPHVSTGEMLRGEVERGSALGREAEPIMAAGALVPDELMVRIIEDRLSRPDAKSGVLLDGFPRTLAQAEALDAMLRRGHRRVAQVIVLDVPEPVLVERLMRRARAEGRDDDTPETVHRRMQVYETETTPVLEHYRQGSGRVVAVDGDGTVDDVRRRIEKVCAQSGRGSATASSV